MSPAQHADRRRPHRRRHVDAAGLVGDDQFRAPDHARQRIQRRFPGHIFQRRISASRARASPKARSSGPPHTTPHQPVSPRTGAPPAPRTAPSATAAPPRSRPGTAQNSVAPAARRADRARPAPARPPGTPSVPARASERALRSNSIRLVAANQSRVPAVADAFCTRVSASRARSNAILTAAPLARVRASSTTGRANAAPEQRRETRPAGFRPSRPPIPRIPDKPARVQRPHPIAEAQPSRHLRPRRMRQQRQFIPVGRIQLSAAPAPHPAKAGNPQCGPAGQPAPAPARRLAARNQPRRPSIAKKNAPAPPSARASLLPVLRPVIVSVAVPKAGNCR